MALSVAAFDGSGVSTSILTALISPSQWPLVSANRSTSSGTLKDNLAVGVDSVLVKEKKPGDLNANTRPSLHPRIHLLREEPHTEDRHGGHGERGQQAPEQR